MYHIFNQSSDILRVPENLMRLRGEVSDSLIVDCIQYFLLSGLCGRVEYTQSCSGDIKKVFNDA